MTLRAALALFSMLALVAACGEVVSGVDSDAGAVAQYEVTFWRPTALTIWTVLVVDDAPTEAARSLRALLAEDLRGFFDQDSGCILGADPAVYRPIDQRLIVVGASGTLEPRFRDDEGLHIAGIDASPDLLLAYEQAGGQAILDMETAEVLPFVGVAELAHYANLIEGQESPRSPAEEELVGLLPELEFSWAALARTRPDESPEHPAVVLAGTRLPWVLGLVYWPEDGYCPSLLAQDEEIPSLEPLGAFWTSPRCFEEADLFSAHLAEKCQGSCLPWAPSVDAVGQATCRVYGDFPVDEDCEKKPGWTFLEATTSQVSGYESQQVNLCELRQAEGAALDACIHDFACEGCEPSFCFRRTFTEGDEDDPAHRRPVPAADPPYCDDSGEPLPVERIRIVHGADQINGPIRVVCQK